MMDDESMNHALCVLGDKICPWCDASWEDDRIWLGDAT